MKNLFQPESVAEVNDRIARLTPASRPQWGRMNVVQAMAHCNAGMDMAMGALQLPRVALPARLLGAVFKPLVLKDGKPMRRNAPSMPGLFKPTEGDLAEECAGLRERIERFAAGGEAICTQHPHPFFGALTPEQWAILAYKHLDHHLRQFGV